MYTIKRKQTIFNLEKCNVTTNENTQYIFMSYHFYIIMSAIKARFPLASYSSHEVLLPLFYEINGNN